MCGLTYHQGRFILFSVIKNGFKQISENVRLAKLYKENPEDKWIDLYDIKMNDGSVKYRTHPKNVYNLRGYINTPIHKEMLMLVNLEPIPSPYELIVVSNIINNKHIPTQSIYSTNDSGHTTRIWLYIKRKRFGKHRIEYIGLF